VKKLIINQPKNANVGIKLLENLAIKNNIAQFDTFYISVAYVRKSGVTQILDALKQFRAHGGYVKAIVGIDDGYTSRDGLAMLGNNVDELYIYHNNRPYQTFHPKMYVFEKKSRSIRRLKRDPEPLYPGSPDRKKFFVSTFFYC
jgi:HKD family nuclease